jgi:hypothetical protein
MLPWLSDRFGKEEKTFYCLKIFCSFRSAAPLLYICDDHGLLYFSLELLATSLLHLSSNFLFPGQMESAVRVQRKASLRGMISCGYPPCYRMERSTNDGIEFILERTSGSVTPSYWSFPNRCLEIRVVREIDIRSYTWIEKC